MALSTDNIWKVFDPQNLNNFMYPARLPALYFAPMEKNNPHICDLAILQTF